MREISERIHELIQEVEDWSAPSATKADPLRAELAVAFEIPLEEVLVYYVSKPGNFSVRFTQPGASKRPGQTGFAIIPDPTHLEPNAMAAVKLLRASDSFRSFGFFEQSPDGVWRLTLVVGPRQDPLFERTLRIWPRARRLVTSAEGLGDLLPPSKTGRSWVEFTKRKNKADQDGWRLGQVLWSPSTKSGGSDCYANMRKAKPGDRVVHVVDGEIAGYSKVYNDYKEQSDEPANVGEWVGHESYYTVELGGYTEVSNPTPLQPFLHDNAEGIRADKGQANVSWYPFQNVGEVGLKASLGGYLYECSDGLYSILRNGLRATDEAAILAFGSVRALEGALIDPARFRTILDLLGARKNVVLQGPPGTGKSFLAKRIAYAHVGREEPERVQMVQFHQSYSYEDFVRGWRPTEDGGFRLVDGVFKAFCDRARGADGDFVFVIDEVNRGNLGKILGELMLLIEPDKRGERFALPLAYRRHDDETFWVPSNVRLLGLMNTADRSLAMVDYALRRRFVFIDCRPEFGDRFVDLLASNGADRALAEWIATRMERLNRTIREDTRNLGPGFEIGHSFFCNGGPNADREWYRRIVSFEILPLLREYWFDDPGKADTHGSELLS